MRGIIVSFEGIDGVGKSTMAKLFYDELKRTQREHNRPVRLEHEPGGTHLGMELHDLLKADGYMSAEAELYLFLAARADLIDRVVRPEMHRGTILILDRYIDSTVAYQVYGRCLHLGKLVDDIHAQMVESLQPSLTFLIDADPEEIKVQRENSLHATNLPPPDRIEAEGIEFQKRVRGGYLAIAHRNTHRVRIIERGDLIETYARVLREWKIYSESVRWG